MKVNNHQRGQCGKIPTQVKPRVLRRFVVDKLKRLMFDAKLNQGDVFREMAARGTPVTRPSVSDAVRGHNPGSIVVPIIIGMLAERFKCTPEKIWQIIEQPAPKLTLPTDIPTLH